MKIFYKLITLFIIAIVGIAITHANDVTIDDPAPDVTIDDPAPDVTIDDPAPDVTIDDPTPDPTDSSKHDKGKKRGKSTPTPTSMPDVTTPASISDTATPAPTNTPDDIDSGGDGDHSEYPLAITVDKSQVYVGQPEDVKFTVMATYPDSCGPNRETGQVCAQALTDFPESGVHVRLEGVASGGGTTDDNGEVTITINANSEGTITAVASRSGYQDSSTTINAKNEQSPDPSPGGSNSGSSSAGGTISNMEPFDNIAKYEIREGNLLFNQSVEYSFSSPEFSIYKVIVNGRQNEFDVPVRVESLKNTSRLAKPAPGIVYKNENIWIGSKKINYIIVKFRVKNSWIDDNGNLNNSRRPYLLKWNGTTWLVYMSNITGKDDSYTYFESQKAIGVVFAISSPIPRIANTDTNITVEEEVIIPEKEEIDITVPKNLPGFDTLVTIIGMILSIIYVVKKK